MQHCKRSTMRAGTFTHEEKKVSDLWQDYCCTRKQNSEQQHESINNHVLETKSARKLVPSQYPWLAFSSSLGPLLSFLHGFTSGSKVSVSLFLVPPLTGAHIGSGHQERSIGHTYHIHRSPLHSLLPIICMLWYALSMYPLGSILSPNNNSHPCCMPFLPLTLRTGYFHIANGMHVINMTQH